MNGGMVVCENLAWIDDLAMASIARGQCQNFIRTRGTCQIPRRLDPLHPLNSNPNPYPSHLPPCILSVSHPPPRAAIAPGRTPHHLVGHPDPWRPSSPSPPPPPLTHGPHLPSLDFPMRPTP